MVRGLMLSALVLVTACDAVFGLNRDDTRGIDAPGDVDGGDDAPSCPAPGIALAFSPSLRSVQTGCTEYTASTDGHAAGFCNYTVFEGPTGALAPVAGLENGEKERFDGPRLPPDGEGLLVRRWNTSTLTSEIGVYARTSGSTFTYVASVQLPGITLDTSARFGTPSRGTGHHRLMVKNVTPMFEIDVDDLGVATTAGDYTEADLGVQGLSLAPNMTADGLRIVFGAADKQGASATFYAERATLSERFGLAHALTGVPYSSDPWLDARCQRLYFSLQGTVFSVDRI